ncbi:trigger factor [Holospora elegans E1]|uniref:Trigger factor n=1 Tax=Holospora elegans E1 TaxID=1427503 RepID=A0A023DZI4_9PROT|nr:trigger factor [Holospora elegans]GAJ46425.1 trigger factor [Holospora elegans E1]
MLEKKVQEIRSVVLDGISIQEGLNEETKKIASKQKVPGFRLGMVPLDILFGMYRENIVSSVLDRVLKEKIKELPEYQEAFRYSVDFDESVQVEMGVPSDISVQVTFAYSSHFSEIEWSEFALPVLDDDISPENVHTFVGRYLKQFNRSEPLDVPRPSELGDTLRLRITIKSDGQERTSVLNVLLSSENFPEDAGIEDFIGIESGHTISQRVKVPKSFSQVPLAGKKVNFSLVVEEVRRTVACEMDDDSAKYVVGCTLETLLDRAKLLLKKFVQKLSYEVQKNCLEVKIFNIKDVSVSDMLRKHRELELRKEYTGNSAFENLVPKDQQSGWFGEIAQGILLTEMFIKDYCSKHPEACEYSSQDVVNFLENLGNSKGVSPDQLVRKYLKDRNFHVSVNDAIRYEKVIRDIIGRCALQDPKDVVSSLWKEASLNQKKYAELFGKFLEDVSVSDYIQKISLKEVDLRGAPDARSKDIIENDEAVDQGEMSESSKPEQETNSLQKEDVLQTDQENSQK